MTSASEAAAGRNRLADEMANGCPTLIEAYRRMGVGVRTGKRYWQAIRVALGPQAI